MITFGRNISSKYKSDNELAHDFRFDERIKYNY